MQRHQNNRKRRFPEGPDKTLIPRKIQAGECDDIGRKSSRWLSPIEVPAAEFGDAHGLRLYQEPRRYVQVRMQPAEA